MKKLLLILLGFAMSSNIAVELPGEYVPIVLDLTAGHAYTIATGTITLISGADNVVGGAGGPHSGCYITAAGVVKCLGQNGNGVIPAGTTADQATAVACTLDSLGATIDPVASVIMGGNAQHNLYWDIFAVTTTGKLYCAGVTQAGVEGNGTYGCAASLRWVQINFAGSHFITKVQGGWGMLAMDLLGNVWTWGADGDSYILGQGNSPTWMTPTTISLPSGRHAIDIAHNGLFGYILLDNGDIMATGSRFYTDYIGMYPVLSMTTSWQVITSTLALPAQIKQIWVNSETSYARLTDSTLWAWGGSGYGTVGNGTMLDMSTWTWNYNATKSTMQQFNPVQISPGTKFKNVYVGYTNSFYTFATDYNDSLYSWGRNKSGVLADSTIGANPVNGGITSSYPDSWGWPWPTMRSPLGQHGYIQSTSPYCQLNPSGFPCNTYTIPTNTAPTARATVNVSGTTATLDGSTSSDNVFIMNRLWMQTAGPTVAAPGIRTNKTLVLNNLAAGTYTWKHWVRDNAFAVDSTTISFTISAAVVTGRCILNRPFRFK